MADDFVKKAFDDARKSSIDKESNLLADILEKKGDIAHLAAATQVGLERMEKLCEVVLNSGNGETLADYAQALILTGFHMGYKTAMEVKE